MKARVAQILLPLLTVVSLFALYQISFDHAVASQHEKSEKDKSQCQKMMKERQEFMSMLKENNKQLEEKLGEMKNAGQEQKVQKIATVVEQLANQHLAMQEKILDMQNGSMGHMMSHMDENNKQAMMQCPMMKSMSKEKKDKDGNRMGHDHN